MKALTLLAGIGIAGLVFAQTGFTYRSPKVDPKLTITGKQGWVELDKSFEVTGGVRLESKTDGYVLTANGVTGDLVKEGKQTQADHLRARGDVTLLKQDKGGTTNITAKEADYDLASATLAKATLRGNVKFNFASEDAKKGGSDIVATSVEATFKRKTEKNEDSLVSMSVVGPLSYSGITTVEKGKSVITARADRMTYETDTEGGTMKLSGNLYFDQKGPGEEDSADVSGAQTVILTLNKAREVVRVRMSSEGIGKIVTKIKKKGGNQA